MDVLSRRVVPLKTSRLLQFLRGTKVPIAVTAAAIFSSFLATAQAQVATKRGPQIAPSALAQIAVLQQEKRNRTPAQRKMSSQLIYANKKIRNAAFARSLPDLRANVNMAADGTVRVDIKATVTKDLTQYIIGQGGTIIGAYVQYGTIIADMPLAKVETLAARSDVRFIRPAFKATTSADFGDRRPGFRSSSAAFADRRPGSAVSPVSALQFGTTTPMNVTATAPQADHLSLTRRLRLAAAVRDAVKKSDTKDGARNIGASGNAFTPGTTQGSAVSQGDATHEAARARSEFGVDGTGVKIGVLSDGVDSLAQSESSGDLNNVTVLPGQAGSGNEGTAMLEIVHDLAPGAQLYFASAKPDKAAFAQNILALKAEGCDIIVDDIIYLDESPFEDGPVAQAVNTVTADGALYFSSAGNEGNKDDGTSGTWEGDFNPSAASDPAPLAGANLHNFGDGGNSIRVDFGGGNPPLLIWAEHYDLSTGTASTDYDLYDMDGGLTTIFDASTDVQDGTGGNDFPIEYIGGGTFGGERLLIDKFAAGTTSSSPMFNLIVFRGTLDPALATSGATRGHSAAAEAFSVAATPALNSFDGFTPNGPYPNLFTATNASESFTSDGPRRLILSPTGAELTPGNRTSTGGVVRQKPNITAADGVTTTVPGFTTFYGTSAAAPHAAAIAALIKSYAPTFTPAQIRTALVSSAIDIETPGSDRDTGAGIIMAYAALDATGIAPPRQLFYQSNTVRSDGGNGNSMIDPNECNLLDVTLRSPRLDTGPITGISGTLSTATPGVTIARATAAYADIAGNSTGTNAVPFQISTDSSFLCGTTIDFTLTITSSDGTFIFPFSIRTGVIGTGSPAEAIDIPIAIPDGQDISGNNPGAAIESNIPVSGFSGLLGKVTVSLYITHSHDNDLNVSLVAPDGTTVKLIKGVGGDGDNFGSSPALADRTVLDDEAANPIAGRTATQAPHVGTFRPIEPLSTLYGKAGAAVNGAWKLRVQDYYQNDTGTLQNWGLTLIPMTCTDGGGACNAAGATSDVTVTTNEDTTYTFEQTDFDAGFDDPNGDFVQKIRIDSLPANGTLRYNNIDVTVGQEIARADLGNLTFVPAANFNGTTSFDWNGNDGQIYSTTGAQVICDVKSVNDVPTLDAIPDPASISEDAVTQTVNLSGITAGPANESAQTLNVTASSSDTSLIPTPTVTYTSPDATGSLSYTPVANANGTATITVTVTDNGQTDGIDDFKSTTRTFTVTVDAVNDAPSFTKGTDQTMNEDAGAQTVANWATAISAGPVDEAGQTVDFTVTNDNNALFSVQPAIASDGTLTYTPAPNANGMATVTVALKDNGGTANGGDDTSADQTFTITVNAENDAPVANDQSVTTAEDTAKAITLIANDIDNASVTYSIVTSPAHGSLSGTAPNLTYTPAANYNGPDSFTFKANDGTADSNTATVSLTVSSVNDAPVANAQSIDTTEDTAKTIALTATDVDGDALVYTVVAQPAHGTLSGTAPNLTYTPASNYNGPDSFTFKTNDGALDSNIATVTINVAAANDAPSAHDDTATTSEDTAIDIDAKSNDTDPDGDTIRITAATDGPETHGIVSVNADGTIRYVPEANFNGTATFSYTVSDGTLEDTAQVIVTVLPANDAPLGVDDNYTSTGASLTVPAPGVLANDTDLDGDTLTAAIATQPAKGTVTLNADGSFTYTPHLDADGADSFTYTVNDGVATATATVNLTIEDAPQSPRLTLQIDPPSFNENAGPAAARATLTRNVDLGTRLSVQVVSSNRREATVPATVEIPSGAKSAQFWIGAVDDGIRDGNKTVTLAALATGYPRITGQVQVLDNGLVHLPLQLRVRPAGFSESDGAKAAIGEVSIPTPAKVDYAIELVSSDESEVRVPRTVTIKAGRTNATFYVSAVDDKVADGVQVVTLTAKRLGFGTANNTLKVSDDETRSLLLSTDSTTVREGGFIVVTLTRNWAINSAMTVLLNSSDTTAAQVPSSVTVPAGATSVTFAVYGITNGTAGDTRSVDVTASRPGLTPDTLTLSVVDTALRASYGAASRVTLSTVAAGVATQSVALKFGAPLNADAVNYADFAVLVNGIPAQIEGVSYDASSSTVTLLLAEGNLKTGERAEVSWSNLLDARGYYSQGQAEVVAR